MTSNQRCPECKQWLDKSALDCLCGWKAKDPNKFSVADYRCWYQIDGRRCPLNGDCSHVLYGNGPWYCIEHLRNLDDPKRCKEILVDAEENFEAIMEREIDWKKRLFPEDYRAMKAMIHQLFLERVKK